MIGTNLKVLNIIACLLLGSYVVYKAGTRKGSSGSPIFKVIDERRMEIAGIHRIGYEDIPSKEFYGYNFGTLMSEIIKFIHNDYFEIKGS